MIIRNDRVARPAPATTPATAPATRPATEPAGELDWKKAAATIDALGGVWLSIHEAVEKNDLDTAAELTGDLIKEAETFRDRTRGTILAVPVNVATGQLNRLHSAMKEKNVEKVRTIMEGIDRIGHSIAEIVRGRNEDQAPPKE